jgi:hypothetical protein
MVKSGRNTYSTRIVEHFVLVMAVDSLCRRGLKTRGRRFEDRLQERLEDTINTDA